MSMIFRKSAIASAVALALGSASQAGAAEVDTKGGIRVKSDDGNFVADLKGRMHFDGYFFQDDSPVDNDNGVDFRRLRLAVESTMYGVYKGKIEVDFRTNRGNNDSTSTVIRDVYLSRTGWGPGTTTIGHFKTPMGLEELTSSNYITFIERSLPVSAVAPNFRRGLGYAGAAGNISYATMLYSGYNRGTASADNRSDGIGLGGRLTWTPIKDKVNLLHLGGSVAFEQNVDTLNDQSTRYEMILADSITFVDFAAPVSANEDNDLRRYGVEAAYVNGPFSAQAEYLMADVDSTAAGDPEWSGWYVMASYFLTGESRPYRASNGTFDRIKPSEKSGAWELAARYSTLDGERSGVADREFRNYTVGVNYYLNPQIRLMANYIQADIDAGAIDADPSTVAFRVQYDF